MEAIETILNDILAELKTLRTQSQQRPLPFLGIEDVAAMLGISPKTVRNQLSKKTFPLRATKIGGRVLFRAADLEAVGK